MHDNTRSGRITKSVLIGSTAIMMGMGLAGIGGAASAQPAAPAASTEVVVTGSRIVRRDYSSNSPIVTVNAQTFENTSNVAIEANLNKLPQFSPAQNMTGVANSGDVQPTALNSIGISTLSLRGLGPNRNLVLADGRRLMPSNGLLVIDVNTIPSAMIERVEVVTGGASAVYGPDAVGGVINFILKKNFQGMDLDTQYGVTQRGDGQEFKISALIGANFADDKGNAMFGVEHFTREPSYQANRAFYTKGWADPTVGGNDFFFHGFAYKSDIFANDPTQAAVNSIFTTPTNPISAQVGPTYWFNADGTLYTGANTAGPTFPGGSYRYKGVVSGRDIAFYNYIDGGKVVQGLKANQTNYFVTAPTNRWTVFGSAHYDFTDDLTFYTRGTFAQTKTRTVLFPTPFITGWGVNVPYDSATNGVASGHPVPTELATLLNARLTDHYCNTPFCQFAPGNQLLTGNLNPALLGTAVPGTGPNSDWQLFSIPSPDSWMPPRSTRDTNTNWQVVAGLKGSVPGTDYTWDLNASHGESSQYSLGEGYASLTRYRALILAPNYGANATITGNQVLPNNGFGAAQIHCTSGFAGAIFNGATPSHDCIEAITARIQNYTAMEQNVVEGTIQGKLLTLPAGDVGISVGGSYREEFLTYTPDVLQSTVSFTDQVAGVYPTAYMNSSWNAKEGFGELLVPVLKDLPGVKSFGLELGARYSSYGAHDRLNNITANLKGGWTYKILGDWAVTDWMRVRGGYNLAVRAPNLGELFLGKQQVFAGGAFTQYGNPCTTATNAPYGANPAKNPNAANARLICEALMTPQGAQNFYNNANNQVAGTPSGFVFTIQNGNPNLQSEKAKTWTAGVVLRSPWMTPALSRLNLSIDWYRIEINDAIQFQAIDDVRAACLTQPVAVATAPGNVPCSLVSYNPGTGQEAPTTIAFDNLSHITTAGVDLQVNWNSDLSDIGLGMVPGAVDVSWQGNWLDYFDSSIKGNATSLRHWAGTLGPVLSGFNPGAYKWKSYLTVGYSQGPAHVSMSWRHLPGVHPQGYAINPSNLISGNNTKDTPAHDEFGLYGNWTIRKNYTLRAGVDNLFDAQPEITGANIAATAGAVASSGQGTTNEGFYDALGRRFYVGLKARF